MSAGSTRRARRFKKFRRWWEHGLVVAAALASTSCIEGDSRCDENQVVVGETCACAPNTAPSPSGYGCTPCGANESVQAGKCACNPGFAKLSPTGMCEMASIGGPCSDDSACQAAFPACVTDGAEKYCSVKGCTATSCPNGYACEQGNGSTFCGKLPAGLGDPCMSDADCTKEAKSCDTMMSKTCIMSGCATKAATCPGFYACCDLSMFVPGFSICAPPSMLMNGQCAFGTTVTP